MFVLFSKIFAVVLAAIAISKSYVDFRSRLESLKIFLFWVVTWLVIVVVIYTAITMLYSAFSESVGLTEAEPARG